MGVSESSLAATLPDVPWKLSRTVLPEIQPRRIDGSFASFTVLPSNVDAAESAMLFASGLLAFVATCGPSGWGKTHLLEAASHKIRSELGLNRVRTLNAVDWVGGSRSSEPHLPLVLDNVQDVLTKTRSRLQLRLALERRVRAGRPTMLAFTDDSTPRGLRSLLPAYRDWRVACIAAPTGAEREVVVSQLAASEGLALSETLRKVLATRLEGNGRTLIGAVKRLRLEQAQWLDAHSTLKACGVLNPFFASNASWDLREHILSVAKSLPAFERGGIDPSEIAIFGMLRVAELCEADIARFMGVEPAKAYTIACRVESRRKKEEHLSSLLARFVDRAVDSLLAN